MQDMLRSVARAVWADGGQRGARRNAWAAMSVDAHRARERAQAAEAMASAVAALGPVPSQAAGSELDIVERTAVGS
ncbi:MAG TPA: hypothetical protein VME70_10735 [Mycobacteriales bacterium]|nr:hypothetical protein [Mycobacteriales bacterium]